MSHGNPSVTSILKILLGLDSLDLKLDYGTIKVHFKALLFNLLMQKLNALFWNSTKIGQKQGIKSNEKLHNLKCTMCIYWYLSCVFSLLLLLINTFNGKIESIVTEMALTEFFCSYYMNKMRKDASLLIGNFHYLITL